MSSLAPSSAEQPWPVSVVNAQVKAWIERLGHIWVEGQITQVNVKKTWKLSYVTLRDVDQEQSIELTAYTSTLTSLATPLRPGDRVVVYGKPAYYAARGKFSLWVTTIRPVGIGELLARIEQLKAALYAEGLFDPRLKKPLPTFPTCVGLITGRGSAAERDVLAVAQERWPAVNFRVRNTAVQGTQAVPEVIAALAELDADPQVDVIIIARGGGSVEDLLPFSDEALARAVSRARTPVVSAIGHEPDNPVLDFVADVRAATPTDAAKRVVPDVVKEYEFLAHARRTAARALWGWLTQERQRIATIRSRPALANPLARVEADRQLLETSELRRDRALAALVREQRSQIGHLRARASSLGPAQTLARGYSVVQVVPRDRSEPLVLTTIADAAPGTQLRVRVADGSLSAVTMGVQPAPVPAAAAPAADTDTPAADTSSDSKDDSNS